MSVTCLKVKYTPQPLEAPCLMCVNLYFSCNVIMLTDTACKKKNSKFTKFAHNAWKREENTNKAKTLFKINKNKQKHG